jgi:diguanylate cyclase (GGDEF)-like protein
MLLGNSSLPTIVLLSTAIAAMLSIVFIHQWRTYRESAAGLGWWSIAPMVGLAGTLLFGGQEILPSVVGRVFGNSVVILSAILFYVGAERFFGNKVPRWPLVVLTLATIALYHYTITDSNFRARLLIVAGAILTIQIAQFSLLWRYRRTTFAGMFLLVATGLAMAMFVTRIATVGFEPLDSHLLKPTKGNSLYLGTFGFWVIGLTVGLILLVQERLREAIETLAHCDALTGLLSRGALFRQGLAAVAEHQRTQHPLTVMLFDIDFFKQTNDTYGHLVGDAVLRDFATRIRAALRPVDIVGRYGGEEFLAVLPGVTSLEAGAIAERIRASGTAAGLPLVTVSVGIASAGPSIARLETSAAFERLVDEADHALYLAKAAGRDRVFCVDRSTERSASPWSPAHTAPASLVR